MFNFLIFYKSFEGSFTIYSFFFVMVIIYEGYEVTFTNQLTHTVLKRYVYIPQVEHIRVDMLNNICIESSSMWFNTDMSMKG